MIVVDTNVVAYLLIEGDRTADAQALRLADPDWRSEPSLLIEFSNLLATQVRAKALSDSQARSLLEAAARQIAAWVEVRHADALAAPPQRCCALTFSSTIVVLDADHSCRSWLRWPNRRWRAGSGMIAR